MVVDNVDIYQRHTFECTCGKMHEMPIGLVEVGPGVSADVPKAVDQLGLGRNVALITDQTIFDAVCTPIVETWERNGLTVHPVILPAGTIPDEKGVGTAVCNIPFETDLLVSIAGGTATDIARYVGSRLKLPVIAIPSAMTMDGFFTNMSVIIVNGVQYTHYLDYPAAILADTSIIAEAPAFMNGAGVGEVIAKVSASMDWWVSHRIKGTYYCDNVAAMMGTCIEEGSSDATVSGIRTGDPASIKALTDGLYRSAVGMAWYESSVCGSGAEHQLNHFWIMCQDFRNAKQSMHGQAVGAGTVANFMIWDEILEIFDTISNQTPSEQLDEPTWREEIKRVYRSGAEDILRLQDGNHLFDQESRRQEIELLQGTIGEIKARRQTLPSVAELQRKLTTAGCPSNPRELGITREEFIDSVLYAKDMRTGRYNSLWILETLGVAKQVAEKVADQLGY